MVNEANYKENHTNNDDVNAPTGDILEEETEDIEPINNNNTLEDEPEDVEPTNNNHNEPVSSIDELTINDV